MQEEHKLLAALGTAGVLIGIAKMLVSEEPLKARQVIGRSILHGGLGIIAAAAVVLVPGLSFTAQVGIACLFASLGSSAVEKFLERWFKNGK